jgi:maltose alpha-D-glucosyltransferase/alpha-amylase
MLAAACLTLAWLTSCSVHRSSEPHPPAAPLAQAHETQQQWVSAEYVDWLERRSMLEQSRQLAPLVSGEGMQWRHEYAEPQPLALVQKASVWVLGYPGAVITPPGRSVIGTWGDPALWKAFDEIGIDLLHTGPVKRSGGIVRKEYTPTIDGWFDRISLEIDPALGTEDDYRRMVAVAEKAGGLVAGDLVPLHTGMGADYLLALRARGEYPGMYTMVEVDRRDWGLLPPVKDEWQTALVSNDVADELTRRGYIPGRISPADADPAVRSSSGWSATGEILGVDGKMRRWVFLHVFKPGQPVLNWLDPTSAAQRAIDGDVVRTVVDLGAKVVRMDAVPFLGLAPREGTTVAANYEHPLSILGTDYLAFMVRKLGGWSFEELNVPFDSLKLYMKEGPDLSYDFYTRTEGLHSLLTRDAGLLRLAYGFLLEAGVQPIRLVHDLQNHDEITYQLVPLEHLGDKVLDFEGRSVTARELREETLNQMRSAEAGEAAPYNLLYRPSRDGLATTYAGFVAAALGIRDLDRITPEQVNEIRRGHLLLAFANAMQPGVFSLSGWDLMGALPLPRQSVAELLQDRDYRWINRGGIDLMGVDPKAEKSSFGLPRARTLYGSLPEQLKDPDSFASQLERILAARKKYHVAEGELVAVADVAHSALCVLVMRVPEGPALAVSALNFGQEPIRERIDLGKVGALALAGRPVLDSVSGEAAGAVDAQGGLSIELEGWSGRMLVVEQPTS